MIGNFGWLNTVPSVCSFLITIVELGVNLIKALKSPNKQSSLSTRADLTFK